MRKKRLKILFAASEVVPFAKTGGLADVAAALPKTLKQLGHDIRVIMPKYASVKDTKYRLREVIRLRDIEVPVGDQTYQISIKSAFIPDTKVQVYFVEHAELYNREGLYTDPKTRSAARARKPAPRSPPAGTGACPPGPRSCR
jgi:starch synthase